MSSKAMTRTVSVLIAVLIVLGAVAGAFYGLSNLAPSSTTSMSATSTQQLQTVVFGFVGPPDVTDTPGFMLWQYYSQQLGLNLQVQYFDGTPSLAAAFLSGSVQVGDGFGIPDTIKVNQRSGNASGSYPFVAFSNYENSLDYALVVSNSIQTWSDLAGQPVGVFAPGSTSDTVCHFLESGHGIPADKQNCLGTGADDARARAMINGRLMGAIIEPFNIIEALATGKFHILTTIAQEGGAFSGVMFNTATAPRAYAQAHPDVLVKIAEATMLADRWAKNESAWIQKEQIEFPGTNVTRAGAAWRIWMAMDFWDPNGGLTYEKLTATEQFYIKKGSIKQFLDPKYWADVSYQDQALKELGAWNGPKLGYPDPSIPAMNVTIPGVSLAIAPFTLPTPPASLNGGANCLWQVSVPTLSRGIKL